MSHFLLHSSITVRKIVRIFVITCCAILFGIFFHRFPKLKIGMQIFASILSLLLALGQGSSVFRKAADFVSSTAPVPASNETRLRVYALYSQATRGDCPEQLDGPIDPIRRLKLDAWCSHRGMTQEDAMTKYVALIDELSPGWRNA